MAGNTLLANSLTRAGSGSSTVDKTLLADSLTHAGGGTLLVMTYLGVVIPGFLVVLVVAAAVGALLIAPFLAVALAAVAIAGPPYGLWRLARRSRKARRRTEPVVQS
jgi:hypothetical protein